MGASWKCSSSEAGPRGHNNLELKWSCAQLACLSVLRETLGTLLLYIVILKLKGLFEDVPGNTLNIFSQRLKIIDIVKKEVRKCQSTGAV